MSLFSFNEKSEYAIIQCPPEMDHLAAKEFSEKSLEWLNRPIKTFVFDFEHVKKIEALIFRPVVLFHQALKKSGRTNFAIAVAAPIRQTLQMGGVNSVFLPRASLADGLNAAGISVARAAIDVKFINSFINATQGAVEAQAGIKLKSGKPFLKTAGQESVMDIAGVISLSSAAFRGTIALCFPAEVFLSINAKMGGNNENNLDQAAQVAAGKLLDIIFSHAKTELNESCGYSISEAVPTTVIKAPDLASHPALRRTALVIPFETERGTFNIEISSESAC